MLVLALETSSRRGSVALVEAGQLLAEAWHDEPNAHGERLLGLIGQVFTMAGRDPSCLARIGAGCGPGAFTGLRIGLALAQGMASGLGVPAVGIGSLRAMAAGVPEECSGNRWPIVDARRNEVFVACYDQGARVLLAPRILPREGLREALVALRESVSRTAESDWMIGQSVDGLPELTAELPGFRKDTSEAASWPSAAAVARLASNPMETGPASPEYLRGADAILPKLPPCPLNKPANLPF